MELTDKSRQEFQRKLENSVIDPRLIPYIYHLEKTNYKAFDVLAMLLLEKGDYAFIQGVRLAIALDPNAPQRIDDSFPF